MLPVSVRIEVPRVEVEGGHFHPTDQRVEAETLFPVRDGRGRNLPLSDVECASSRAIALHRLRNRIERLGTRTQVGAIEERVGERLIEQVCCVDTAVRCGIRNELPDPPHLRGYSRIEARVEMRAETSGRQEADACRETVVHAARVDVALAVIAMVGVVATVPHRLQARQQDAFEEVRLERSELRQIPDGMNHPLRNARLLKVGEAERPGRILRVDDVTDAKRQRLSPHHDLIADVGGHRTGLVLPPRVANRVLVVERVRRTCRCRWRC